MTETTQKCEETTRDGACVLPKGHQGVHDNGRGMKWGNDAQMWDYCIELDAKEERLYQKRKGQ